MLCAILQQLSFRLGKKYGLEEFCVDFEEI